MLISSELVTAEVLISQSGSELLRALVVRVIRVGLEISPVSFSRVRASVVVCLGNFT